MKNGLMIGASIGNCVHVAGVAHFLDLAKDQGYDTLFAGPALGVDALLALIQRHEPSYVAVGYRLTPANALGILSELKAKAPELPLQPAWIFGGTAPVAAVAKTLDFFDHIFDGTEDLDDCIAYLRGVSSGAGGEERPETSLLPRMKQKHPYPLLRHHFGLPSLEETARGIREIADSRVLDIISLGIDQNTQQFFFHPERRSPELDGAGGVPVKSAEEFRLLKEASLSGNFPLMRCYSGTADVIPFARVLADCIDNAWCAVPLFWYNELDGRGTRPLKDSMTDAQELVRWHAQRGIPVELNEPHHWGLRDAHDTISVAASYLSAYQAKKLGVRHYIAQYMFNVPNSMSFSMDLAKVLAQIELTESLQDDAFSTCRQTRAGLPFLSGDFAVAKGQLAASTMLQMAVHPDIIHVVGYSEAEYAATPEVVIESTKLVRGVIRSCLGGNADSRKDPAVLSRKEELVREATVLLGFIKDFYKEQSEDPLLDPAVLADCVRRGILDAPHITKNDVYRGILTSRMVDGKCLAWDNDARTPLTEPARLETLRKAGLLEHSPLPGAARQAPVYKEG